MIIEISYKADNAVESKLANVQTKILAFNILPQICTTSA